jgi:hypothetical protein
MDLFDLEHDLFQKLHLSPSSNPYMPLDTKKEITMVFIALSLIFYIVMESFERMVSSNNYYWSRLQIFWCIVVSSMYVASSVYYARYAWVVFGFSEWPFFCTIYIFLFLFFYFYYRIYILGNSSLANEPIDEIEKGKQITDFVIYSLYYMFVSLIIFIFFCQHFDETFFVIFGLFPSGIAFIVNSYSSASKLRFIIIPFLGNHKESNHLLGEK